MNSALKALKAVLVILLFIAGGYVIGTYDGFWDAFGVWLMLFANNLERQDVKGGKD